MDHTNTVRVNNTDKLTNSLAKREYIRTTKVEKIFRSVNSKYFDFNWHSEELHYFEPCVFATVLECLELDSGHRFLNIGSGTGYLNTVVGLLLGRNGINHGIEVDQSLIDCSHRNVNGFILNAAAIDHYDFCVPFFMHGNICELQSVDFYDRVYCGANVLPEQSDIMKNLIKIGGILVISLNGSLIKVERKSENSWNLFEELQVSFKDLILPERCNLNKVKFPSVEPLSLKDSCRSNIRSLLRRNLHIQFPNLEMSTICKLNTIPMDRKYIIYDSFTHYFRFQYGLTHRLLHLPIQNTYDLFRELYNLYDTSSMSGSGVSRNHDTVTAVSLINTNKHEETADTDHNRVYLSFYNFSNEKNGLLNYNFIRDYRRNKLSKLLKNKINTLPLPDSLKMFLNHNRRG